MDVANHASTCIAEAGVDSGNMVHYGTQQYAVRVEAIAPSQSGIRPVDNKGQFVAAIAHPVHQVVSVDGGILYGPVVRGYGDRIDGSGIDISVEPAQTVIVEAVHCHTVCRVGPAAEIAVMHRCAHSGGHDAIQGVLPVVAGSNLQGIVVLSKPNVVQHSRGAKGQTGVGGSQVVDYRGHRNALGVEAVAPRQSGIRPVHHKGQLVVACTHPIQDVACVNSGVNGILCKKPAPHDYTCK